MSLSLTSGLPEEITCQIFNRLTPKEKETIKPACKFFKDIADDRLLLENDSKTGCDLTIRQMVLLLKTPKISQETRSAIKSSLLNKISTIDLKIFKKGTQNEVENYLNVLKEARDMDCFSDEGAYNAKRLGILERQFVESPYFSESFVAKIFNQHLDYLTSKNEDVVDPLFIHEAIWEHAPCLMKMIHSKGANFKTFLPTYGKSTPLNVLLISVTENTYDPLCVQRSKQVKKCIDTLIQSGADVNLHSDEPFIYPSHSLAIAARFGLIEELKILLDLGANINEKDKYSTNFKGTALHIAAMVNQFEIIRLLIDKGADVSIKDIRDLTAEDYLIQAGHWEEAHQLFGTPLPYWNRLKNRIADILDTIFSLF
jgi:hypothetical protein